MKIKQEIFGSITLGACSVKLTKNGSTFKIKMSQGTSSKYRETTDASLANEIFRQYCDEAYKNHGQFQGLILY